MYQASAADQLGAVHGAFHDLAAAFTIRFTPPIQCRILQLLFPGL